ncbi:efflux RND transporter periplasmic adaptor subunit [Shewanella electrodiphila]|uniref:Efflux RND transporter periplasmic adaptor subunit n=1 Tax=Shewanella electrodiphila TaxID=934143 RepID=A0ABT0KVH4_9GAMM|nr:efflux RND transporter periplasmic adaptor subunit [Shewanella electrodiphila]MCL1047852.1 efflux RND transporter periplasmic adaptor subunit [Shewanella electrodiphila]
MKINKFAKLTQIALVVALASGCSNEAKIETKPIQPVSVITLGESNISHDLRFSGVLEAQEKARLAFRVTGTLIEINVAQGERVNKGQVIARLDPHDYQVRVAELEGRLTEANASYDQAKNEFDRTQIAINGNAMSDISLDRAKTGMTRAKAAVTVVEQNLEQAKDALAYTELVAPFSGIIGQRSFDNFEQVSPGISFVTLHQPEKLQAIVDIPETMLQAFSHGQAALVFTDSAGNLDKQAAIKGTVTEIATIPDRIKRTFSATIALDEKQANLYPGKVVNVRIADQTIDPNSICLPAGALVSSQNTPQITKIVDNIAKRVDVEVIKQGRNDICVTGDIAKNDVVVVAGGAFIYDGKAVEKTLPMGGVL